MPQFKVQSQKKLPQKKEAKDLEEANVSGSTVNSNPTRDVRRVGSSIVRRNEPDDQD